MTRGIFLFGLVLCVGACSIATNNTLSNVGGNVDLDLIAQKGGKIKRIDSKKIRTKGTITVRIQKYKRIFNAPCPQTSVLELQGVEVIGVNGKRANKVPGQMCSIYSDDCNECMSNDILYFDNEQIVYKLNIKQRGYIDSLPDGIYNLNIFWGSGRVAKLDGVVIIEVFGEEKTVR